MIKILDPRTALADASDKARPLLQFLASAEQQTVKSCTGNSDANLLVATCGDGVVPIAVSRNGGGTGYLVSTTRLYMDGAALEFANKSDWVLRSLGLVASAAGHAGRALGLDNIISLNNVLHPTGASIDWSDFDVGELTTALTARFPTHAICVRGLNDRQDNDIIQRMRNAGYALVLTRPIMLLDAGGSDFRMTKELKRDRNRAERLEGLLPFHGGPFSTEDYARMADLCYRTNVAEHGFINPHYAPQFFRFAHETRLYRFHGLRDENGRIAGFISTTRNGRGYCCGTFGRELVGPQANHIYPALLAMAMMEAVEARSIINLGFGAFDFKRRRGTTQALEFYAFYTAHLGRAERLLWDALTSGINATAGPAMKRL